MKTQHVDVFLLLCLLASFLAMAREAYSQRAVAAYWKEQTRIESEIDSNIYKAAWYHCSGGVEVQHQDLDGNVVVP